MQLSTGIVRPIASGVALKYFSAGCGIADQAALTTRSVLSSVTVLGQVTSTVPTTGLVGAMGPHLVTLPKLCSRRFGYTDTKPVKRRHSTKVSATVLLIRRLWVESHGAQLS